MNFKLEQNLIIVTSVLGGAWLVMMLVVVVLCCQMKSIKKKLADIQNSKIRVQKLKLDSDKNHAFHNPALSPDEELSRRGYSMYMGPDSQSDVESGKHRTERYSDRHQERQTGGQFVEELIHELDSRQHRQQTSAPPFLLQSIQDNKMKTRSTINPVANSNGRQSETNPNFIY